MKTRPFIRKATILFTCMWIVAAAWQSFTTVPQTIAHSLAQSARPDRQARQVADLVRAHVPLTSKLTVLYLNGIDGGDNFYRVRYLLYPLSFVDYWSWNDPNQGGYVWNIPRFTQAASLRRIMLGRRVSYVIAIDHPAILRLLHAPADGLYLYRVQRRKLLAGATLASALTLVVKEP
ncbi:MAG: hypothetical protein ACYCVB_06385 [Bacilli bacterium]